jgi:hypothetical protein
MNTPHVICGALLFLAVLLGRMATRTNKNRPKYLDDKTRTQLLGAVTRAYNAD